MQRVLVCRSKFIAEGIAGPLAARPKRVTNEVLILAVEFVFVEIIGDWRGCGLNVIGD